MKIKLKTTELTPGEAAILEDSEGYVEGELMRETKTKLHIQFIELGEKAICLTKDQCEDIEISEDENDED